MLCNIKLFLNPMVQEHMANDNADLFQNRSNGDHQLCVVCGVDMMRWLNLA
jgi:hypothetical protein